MKARGPFMKAQDPLYEGTGAFMKRSLCLHGKDPVFFPSTACTF